MSRLRFLCGLGVAAVVLGTGCSEATNREQKRVRYEVQQGQYATAAARVNGLYDSHEAGEPAKPRGSAQDDQTIAGKHALLWRMERGMIAQVQGDLAAADRHYDDAARLVDIRRTTSVTRDVGTYAVNDTLREFAGEAFEHTQVDAQRLLTRLMRGEIQAGLWTPVSAITTGPATDAGDAQFEAALVRARRMTLDQLIETSDAAGGRRYRDDAFARLLAALTVWTLPPIERSGTDTQFAQVMFRRAMETYAEELAKLGADPYSAYHLTRRPALAERLYLRHAQAYDADGFAEQARRYGIDPTTVQPLLPSNGMVLVLNQVGFIAKREALSVGVGTFAPAVTAGESARGYSASSISIGGVGFWVKGPGAEVAAGWLPVPIPNGVFRRLTPGGLAVMGFEIPSYARDGAMPAPARLSVDGSTQTLELVSDLDSYARITLKDEQPALLAKTISRAVAKQAVVAVAAEGMRRSHKGDDADVGALLALAVNLLGSLAATATEVADLRAWSTLPHHVEAACVDLPAGPHTLTLETPTGVQQLGRVTVTPGRLLIISTRTFPNPLPPPAD